MGSFEGRTLKAYLDQEARDRRDEILDHLKRNYDGPSDFFKQKLKEEKALNVEERIQKLESEVWDKKEDLDKLRQIKNEREKQDKLRDKKELLKEKQKKLREASDKANLTKEDAEQEALNQLRNHSRFSDMSEEELRELPAFERKVDSLLGIDLDQLVEDVQRLQEQVADLNGGREEWFMDLEPEALEVDNSA